MVGPHPKIPRLLHLIACIIMNATRCQNYDGDGTRGLNYKNLQKFLCKNTSNFLHMRRAPIVKNGKCTKISKISKKLREPSARGFLILKSI